MADDLLAQVIARRTSAPTLALGAMNFGKRTSPNESRAVLDRALELGIRHFDTANAYVDGASERIVGEALRARRDDAVIATKCGFGRVAGSPEGLSKDRILRACDESLERLGVDAIDIYYLHVPDHRTPIAETLSAIAELLEAKKIRGWGISNYAAWQVLEMCNVADAREMPRPCIAQQLYNVLIRQLDVEYFPFARAYGIPTIVYNPLAGGLLTGKHSRDGSTQRGSRFDKNRLYQGRYFTDAMFDRVGSLNEVARDEKMSLLELAYAWLASSSSVDSILLGPASVAQLEEGVAACKRVLSADTLARIDALHREWLGTDTNYVR